MLISILEFKNRHFEIPIESYFDGKSILILDRGVASSKSQGGPKAQFCHTFQKIHFLLHFYVTIFWDFKSQGGPRPPRTPQLRRPCEYYTKIGNKRLKFLNGYFFEINPFLIYFTKYSVNLTFK